MNMPSTSLSTAPALSHVRLVERGPDGEVRALPGVAAGPGQAGAASWQPHRRRPRERVREEIEAAAGDDGPGEGGWSGGFANQAHWDPTRARDWRCWAQSGPTWSAHCGAEVDARDTLGLCPRHRRSLLEGAEVDGPAERGVPVASGRDLTPSVVGAQVS
jgi:hypothetical protein